MNRVFSQLGLPQNAPSNQEQLPPVLTASHCIEASANPLCVRAVRLVL